MAFGNAKLHCLTGTFSLPAGHTCPQALLCRTRADRITGELDDKQTDNPLHVRCFAASDECRSPQARRARWHNLDLLISSDNMEALIASSLIYNGADKCRYFRVHISGDFFSSDYMVAWFAAAHRFPEVTFYAYTKCLSMWLKHESHRPNNFLLTASWGGREDHLIFRHPEVFVRHARIVYSQEEADSLGLDIDHDDSHCFGDRPFALLIHGSQQPETIAGEAIRRLRRQGLTGYSRKRRQVGKPELLSTDNAGT
ncbi:GP88 family protein [Synechococcus elongatus]|uniref:GP88 family protein n=1 Tax=Synechococcus elongatus TaxID=32046 RepID=UPI0012602EBF|nr:hypothetical protein [Synechococcus elongatus]